MRDFTLDSYRLLLEQLQAHGYELIRYEQYCEGYRPERFVILRHDVDKKPANSLLTAQIEHSIGAQASYYFRVGKESNNPSIIRSIAALGHEIGYHYEDMSIANGDIEKAYSHFVIWLNYFRQYYAVDTICMHGAPTTQYDGRELWKHYDYKELGIIGEPYFDTNFGEVFYLTDTGRCWDGYRVSVRDKIPTRHDEWIAKGWHFHSTADILQALEENRLPRQIMMTTHPQRWTNKHAQWIQELIIQNIKNIIKRALLIARKEK